MKAAAEPGSGDWKRLIHETSECTLKPRSAEAAASPDQSLTGDGVGVFAQRCIAAGEEVLRHGWAEHTGRCEGLVKVPLAALAALPAVATAPFCPPRRDPRDRDHLEVFREEFTDDPVRTIDTVAASRNLQRRFYRDGHHQAVPLDGGVKLTFEQLINQSESASNVRCETIKREMGGEEVEVQRYVATRDVERGEELLLEEGGGGCPCGKPGRHARVLPEGPELTKLIESIPEMAGLSLRIAASAVEGVGVAACSPLPKGLSFSLLAEELTPEHLAWPLKMKPINGRRLRKIHHRSFLWLGFDDSAAQEIRKRYGFGAEMMGVPMTGLNQMTYMQYTNHSDTPNVRAINPWECLADIPAGAELLEQYWSAAAPGQGNDMYEYFCVQISKTAMPPWQQCWGQYCDEMSNSKCTACGIARYCSRKCQSGDWKRHKLDCKRRAEIAADIVATV